MANLRIQKWPDLRLAKANLMPFGPGKIQVPGFDLTLYVVVIISGRGVITAGGYQFDLVVGDALIIPWAEVVSYAADKIQGMTIASLHFVPAQIHLADDEPAHQGDLGQARARLSPSGLPRIPHKVDSRNCKPTLFDLALAMVKAWSLKSVDKYWREKRLHGLTTCLLTTLDHPPMNDDRLDALLWWISGNFQHSISRSELCRRAGLGSTALGHAMRNATGLSPTSYIISLRLDRARELLINTRMSVQDVANVVGIPDRSHFSKLYGRQFGHPPRREAR